jgi:hypothetical protein
MTELLPAGQNVLVRRNNGEIQVWKAVDAVNPKSGNQFAISQEKEWSVDSDHNRVLSKVRKGIPDEALSPDGQELLAEELAASRPSFDSSQLDGRSESDHAEGIVKSGDIVTVPSKEVISLELTPDQISAKLSAMDANARQMQAAADLLPSPSVDEAREAVASAFSVNSDDTPEHV